MISSQVQVHVFLLPRAWLELSCCRCGLLFFDGEKVVSEPFYDRNGRTQRRFYHVRCFNGKHGQHGHDRAILRL